MKNPTTGAVYILLEARLAELPGAVPKAAKKKKGKVDAPEQPPFEVCFDRQFSHLLCAPGRRGHIQS